MLVMNISANHRYVETLHFFELQQFSLSCENVASCLLSLRPKQPPPQKKTPKHLVMVLKTIVSFMKPGFIASTEAGYRPEVSHLQMLKCSLEL